MELSYTVLDQKYPSLPGPYKASEYTTPARLKYKGATNSPWSLPLIYPNTEDKGFVYSPLFFVRGGDIISRTLYRAGYAGYYWSSTVQSDTDARGLSFSSGGSITQGSNDRNYGFSLRCVAYIPIPKIKVLSIAHYSSSAEAASAVAL